MIVTEIYQITTEIYQITNGIIKQRYIFYSLNTKNVTIYRKIKISKCLVAIR